jgi:hypothetical protein
MADAGSQELLSDHLIAHDKGGYQAQFFLHLPRWYVELEPLAERMVDDVSI